MISAGAFEKIVSMSSQQIKSSESNIQGVIGLEIMRSDLEHAGYGLPWELSFVADFEESTKAANLLANGIDPKAFNDKNMSAAVDSNKVPRAIQSAAAVGAGVAGNGVRGGGRGAGAAVRGLRRRHRCAHRRGSPA